MWTHEPGAPGSEAHSTIEYALSGSLCTNDILFPAIEMVSRSPGRSAMPLPSFATAFSPSSRHSRRGCGHPSAFCHAVKFRGSAFPQDFYEKALFVKTDVAVAPCGPAQLLCALRALCFYSHFR